MIRSVLNIPEQKLNQIDCPISISAYDRKVLTELCKILKPLEDATLLVQREKNVSGSMVIPVTLGLKKHLQSVKCDYSTKFVSSLLSSLSKRLSQYENDDVYKTSAMLDTRFKVLWCEPEEIEETTTSLKKKVSFVESVAQIDNSDDNITPPSKKLKTDDFLSFLPKGTPKRKRHTSGSSKLVDDYFEEECDESDANPLLYWKENQYKYPELSKLALKYLTVPASSAPVERLFRIEGKVFRSDRMRMKDQTFETLMMIKCNSNI